MREEKKKEIRDQVLKLSEEFARYGVLIISDFAKPEIYKYYDLFQEVAINNRDKVFLTVIVKDIERGVTDKVTIKADGNTFPHKEALKKLGFKWYGKYEGWIKVVSFQDLENELKRFVEAIWK